MKEDGKIPCLKENGNLAILSADVAETGMGTQVRGVWQEKSPTVYRPKGGEPPAGRKGSF